MEHVKLKDKIIKQVEEADDEILHLLETIFENYSSTKKYTFPETAQKLILQAMEESDNGSVKPYVEIKSTYLDRKKSS